MVEDDEDPDAPAPLNDVGYHIQIPQEIAMRRIVKGAYGMRREEDHRVRARTTAWCDELDAYAKTFDPSMRVQPQPSGEDFMGFDTWSVIVFSRVAGEDIEGGRLFLHEAGYNVDSITLYYCPAMA